MEYPYIYKQKAKSSPPLDYKNIDVICGDNSNNSNVQRHNSRLPHRNYAFTDASERSSLRRYELPFKRYRHMNFSTQKINLRENIRLNNCSSL
ncbi:hypothetical protein PFDG_04964 [Plasmodium falciparum Dd2]|uniref:Uncharacterized protein n=1 Tax=Plasmodium falciparum (isolate Dd2) TaxID=57267 RepID=A0A0L7MA05_PLAF4|nr:hypothetical protein PFDG_04964 [Plasmodium falciparum Dd2]